MLESRQRWLRTSNCVSKLYEDETTNRLDESLALFDELIRNRHLQDVPVILVLNKRELFREKVVGISNCSGAVRT